MVPGPQDVCDFHYSSCLDMCWHIPSWRCDPPWSGPECAEPSVAAAPSAVRRLLRLLMLLSAAVVCGLGLGYLHGRYGATLLGPKRRGYQRIGEAPRDL